MDGLFNFMNPPHQYPDPFIGKEKVNELANGSKHINWITKITPQQREMIEKFFQLFDIEYEMREQ